LVDKKFTPKYPPNIRYFSQISTLFHLNSRISIACGEGGQQLKKDWEISFKPMNESLSRSSRSIYLDITSHKPDFSPYAVSTTL
jgi:hypothetical protein